VKSSDFDRRDFFTDNALLDDPYDDLAAMREEWRTETD
jgi:hypothetical protein